MLASRRYINEVKDIDNTRYFVGIKGDVEDFENLSGAAKDLGEIVGAQRVVKFGLTNKVPEVFRETPTGSFTATSYPGPPAFSTITPETLRELHRRN